MPKRPKRRGTPCFINFQVTADMHAKLCNLVEETGQSVTKIVTRAIWAVIHNNSRRKKYKNYPEHAERIRAEVRLAHRLKGSRPSRSIKCTSCGAYSIRRHVCFRCGKEYTHDEILELHAERQREISSRRVNNERARNAVTTVDQPEE